MNKIASALLSILVLIPLNSGAKDVSKPISENSAAAFYDLDYLDFVKKWMPKSTFNIIGNMVNPLQALSSTGDNITRNYWIRDKPNLLQDAQATFNKYCASKKGKVELVFDNLFCLSEQESSMMRWEENAFNFQGQIYFFHSAGAGVVNHYTNLKQQQTVATNHLLKLIFKEIYSLKSGMRISTNHYGTGLIVMLIEVETDGKLIIFQPDSGQARVISVEEVKAILSR